MPLSLIADDLIGENLSMDKREKRRLGCKPLNVRAIERIGRCTHDRPSQS